MSLTLAEMGAFVLGALASGPWGAWAMYVWWPTAEPDGEAGAGRATAAQQQPRNETAFSKASSGALGKHVPRIHNDREDEEDVAAVEGETGGMAAALTLLAKNNQAALTQLLAGKDSTANALAAPTSSSEATSFCTLLPFEGPWNGNEKASVFTFKDQVKGHALFEDEAGKLDANQ